MLPLQHNYVASATSGKLNAGSAFILRHSSNDSEAEIELLS